MLDTTSPSDYDKQFYTESYGAIFSRSITEVPTTAPMRGRAPSFDTKRASFMNLFWPMRRVSVTANRGSYESEHRIVGGANFKGF